MISLLMPEISLLPSFSCMTASTSVSALHCVASHHISENSGVCSPSCMQCNLLLQWSAAPAKPLVQSLRWENKHPMCLCGHRLNKNLHGFVLLGQQPHHLQAYRRVVQSSQRVMLTLGHAVIGYSQDLPGLVSHSLLPWLPKKHDCSDACLLCYGQFSSNQLP